MYNSSWCPLLHTWQTVNYPISVKYQPYLLCLSASSSSTSSTVSSTDALILLFSVTLITLEKINLHLKYPLIKLCWKKWKKTAWKFYAKLLQYFVWGKTARKLGENERFHWLKHVKSTRNPRNKRDAYSC